MQQTEYEKGLLVQAAWRLSRSNDINELMAVACVVRNWVVPRPGLVREPMRRDLYHQTYSSAVSEFYDVYPVRGLPSIDEPVLLDPAEGLLLAIDGLYDCTTPDMTSSRAFPGGARYFGRMGTPEWIKSDIISRPEQHPLIGNFGSQQFFA